MRLIAAPTVMIALRQNIALTQKGSCPNDSGNPFARPNGSITNGKESEQPLTVAKLSAIALVTG